MLSATYIREKGFKEQGRGHDVTVIRHFIRESIKEGEQGGRSVGRAADTGISLLGEVFRKTIF